MEGDRWMEGMGGAGQSEKRGRRKKGINTVTHAERTQRRSIGFQSDREVRLKRMLSEIVEDEK
jgi:hypothetical protein